MHNYIDILLFNFAHFLLEATKGRMMKWVIFPADKYSPSIVLEFIVKNISNL